MGGSGGMLPRKFWNLDVWKCYFQCFPDSTWALRTIKIKTIVTILYVYYNGSFPQNLNHWLWSRCHFGTCENLGSSPEKMSQAFHGPSITSIYFLYFHRKVNAFKTPEMCLYLDSDVRVGCFTIIFAGSFHYFKPVSCWILFCENVAGVPWPFNQFPSRVAKVNTFQTPETHLYFDSDVWGGCLTIIFVASFSYFKLLTKINRKVRRK